MSPRVLPFAEAAVAVDRWDRVFVQSLVWQGGGWQPALHGDKRQRR